MASSNILFCFILASFLSFATTEAQDTPSYFYNVCSGDNTTANSAFHLNLRILLSSLSSNATRDTQFYNTTVTGRDHSGSVYGLFMCRGDVPSQLCQKCVLNATQLLSSECPLSKEALIWYDECMVRYSNSSSFSTMDTSYRYFSGWSSAKVSDPESFKLLLFSTMNETADEAASHPIGEKKFATREKNISESQILYCLVQCTPDLSPHNCRGCLSGAIEQLPSGTQGGQVLNPSCNIRYQFYPFYRSNISSPTPAPQLVPATKNTSHADSKFSEDPVYLSHNCYYSNDDSNFQIDTKTLLSYMSSNATSGQKFYKAHIPDSVYGHYMCRGDVPPHLCGQCILNATHRISSECRSSGQAIIWYSQCMLRYSDSDFFATADTSPIFSDLNITNTSSPIPEQNSFTVTLSNELDQLATATARSDGKYGTRSLKLNDLQTLYSLGQCTQDLNSYDCRGCLEDIIGTAIPWSRLGSVGGRVLYPSCNLRFELFQFYREGYEVQPLKWPRSPSAAVLTS